jgi:hypothetical protein
MKASDAHSSHALSSLIEILPPLLPLNMAHFALLLMGLSVVSEWLMTFKFEAWIFGKKGALLIPI